MKYEFFEKYKLKIKRIESKYGSNLAYTGDPSYPNGNLLAIVAGHVPMNLRYFKCLSNKEEIELIEKLLISGRENDRYPLTNESGQVAIYKDKSYVYDTMSNGSVLGHLDIFSNEYDEKDETPIMILPSEDMLGILKDYMSWKDLSTY